MSCYNRRKFLKTTLLGSGGLLLSTLPVKGNSQSVSAASEINKKKRLLQKEAGNAFYRREYDRAEAVYKQFIESYPDDVSGYDGLAKVYNHSQKKVETVELYQSALAQNKLNPVFYDRLARAINSLSLGNSKQEKVYMSISGETFLLGSSALLYLQAIHLAPNKKYLYEGLLDTTRCLEKKNKQLKHFNQPLLSFSEELSSRISQVTSLYQESWKESRNSLPLGKKTENLPLSLNKIKEKKRRELYFEDEKRCREESIIKKEKEWIYPFFLKSVKDNRTAEMENYFSQIKEISPSDTQSKHLLTKRYKRNKDYKKLVDFHTEEVSNSADRNNVNPFWSKIRLAQAMASNAQASNSKQQIEEALNVYRQAEQQLEIEKQNLKALSALYGGMAQCYFALSAVEKGREMIAKGLERIPPASGIAYSLLINYAESYGFGNKTEEAETILLKLSESNTQKEITDPFIASYIKERESEIQWEKENNVGQWKEERKERKRKNKEKRGVTMRNNSSSPDKLKSSYALAKIYEKKKNTKRYDDVLTYIEKENKGNEFVEKRKRKHS